MSELTKLEQLSDELKNYLQLSLQIYKLELINKVSTFGSVAISWVVVAGSVLFVVLFVSIGLGFYLSALLGDTYSGFAIVAAFYLLLALVLSLGRRKMIENPLRDMLITKILEEKEP